jgi:hypothetical protein
MRRKQRPYDPLAPTRPRALRRQVRQDVRMNTKPLIRDITREIDRRALAGGQNISGITAELAKNLGGLAPQEAAIYGAAKQDLGQLDTAIADRLTAAGATGEADLRKQFAQMGIPSSLVESLAGGARAAGAGAGASGYARGSAEVAALNARGAGAQDYAAKLPGLARLSGLQGIKELQAGAQRDLATQLDRVRAQTPSLIASSLRDARNREINKATANLGFQSDVYGQQQQNVRTQTQQSGATQRSTYSQRQQNKRSTASNAQRRQDRIERRRHNKKLEKAKKKKGSDSNPFGGD